MLLTCEVPWNDQFIKDTLALGVTIEEATVEPPDAQGHQTAYVLLAIPDDKENRVIQHLTSMGVSYRVIPDN